MTDRYTTRPLWRTRLHGYILAAAILGLAACLVRMGWLCWTV